MSPIFTAAIAQAAAGSAALAAAMAVPALGAQPLLLAVGQGLLAALIAAQLRSPSWWVVIHLVFMPAVVAASRLDIDPGWYLGAFLILLATFWRTDRSRVPLYLSNSATGEAVLGLLPAGPCRVLDLGCGDGAMLRRLARQRPESEFHGIEHAPLPWAWARLAAVGLPNCHIRYGNFWRQPLAGFDFVYAFLSPEPMTRLWDKARKEMSRDGILVSNSFPIPEVGPERCLELPDRRSTRLFCYRPGSQ